MGSCSGHHASSIEPSDGDQSPSLLLPCILDLEPANISKHPSKSWCKYPVAGDAPSCQNQVSPAQTLISKQSLHPDTSLEELTWAVLWEFRNHQGIKHPCYSSSWTHHFTCLETSVHKCTSITLTTLHTSTLSQKSLDITEHPLVRPEWNRFQSITTVAHLVILHSCNQKTDASRVLWCFWSFWAFWAQELLRSLNVICYDQSSAYASIISEHASASTNAFVAQSTITFAFLAQCIPDQLSRLQYLSAQCILSIRYMGDLPSVSSTSIQSSFHLISRFFLLLSCSLKTSFVRDNDQAHCLRCQAKYFLKPWLTRRGVANSRCTRLTCKFGHCAVLVDHFRIRLCWSSTLIRSHAAKAAEHENSENSAHVHLW